MHVVNLKQHVTEGSIFETGVQPKIWLWVWESLLQLTNELLGCERYAEQDKLSLFGQDLLGNQVCQAKKC